MEQWKAFGQGAAVVPVRSDQQRHVAAAEGQRSRAPSRAAASGRSVEPDGTTIGTDAEVAKLLKQPANGTGMDALLRAVVYKQWEGLANHISEPSFCKMTDRRGCTPLHLSVSHNGPLTLIKSLLKTWPGAAAAKDADGATALHHAVAKRASVDTVVALLEANPEAVKLQSTLKLTVPAVESVAGGGLTQAIATSADATHGFTPLHWALLMRSTDVVELFLKAEGGHGKESAAVPCAAGRLPLHTAAANEASLTTIKAIIEVHPMGLKHTDKHGATPLHHAAAHCAPVESMAELSTQHPAAVQAKANNGWTPLHYLVACGNASTPEAARLFINSWSGAVTACDDQARTPLHVAVACGAPPAVVTALLQRWTGAAAARQQDAGGHTPLHWAAQKSSVVDIVRAVRSAYPAAVAMVTTESGCTPAHLAAARGGAMTVEMMSEVLKGEDAHPVLLLKSHQDFTPLHTAVHSGCSADVIQLLATLCPHACRIQANKSQGRTPLHIAAVAALKRKTDDGNDTSSEHRRACSVVLALIAADPETVHLLQAFDKPRARGRGESGAAIVARLRQGDAGDAVREAVERCHQEGAAASDAKAAELLAMLAKEEALAEKKKAKSKKQKEKPNPTQLPIESDSDSAITSLKRVETGNSQQLTEVERGQHDNNLVETLSTVTFAGDDAGVWITSGKGRNSRRKATGGTATTQNADAQLQPAEVVAKVPTIASDTCVVEAARSHPASMPSTTKRSVTQASCEKQCQPAAGAGAGPSQKGSPGNEYKRDGGGGVMLMEELWDHKHNPTHIHTAAPAVSHKLQLRSHGQNIPAGLERQKAGKQLFMEALWATRGRGSQKWPTDLSRSHYQGFSTGQGLHGAHGARQPDSLQVCPQCGWTLGSSRPPKRKLLITDPATGAPIIATPNDSVVQEPTRSPHMKDWNVADVCEFVASLLPGSTYRSILCDHEVDGGALSTLDNICSKGFELLGITKFGHVHKIASAVATLKSEQTPDEDQPNASPATAFESGERKNAATNTTQTSDPLGKLSSTEAAGRGSRGNKLGSPGVVAKAGGVQSGHDDSRLDLPAPPPNEFFCPISFGERPDLSCIVAWKCALCLMRYHRVNEVDWHNRIFLLWY